MVNSRQVSVGEGIKVTQRWYGPQITVEAYQTAFWLRFYGSHAKDMDLPVLQRRASELRGAAKQGVLSATLDALTDRLEWSQARRKSPELPPVREVFGSVYNHVQGYWASNKYSGLIDTLELSALEQEIESRAEVSAMKNF